MELREIHRRLLVETLRRMRAIESPQPKGYVSKWQLADHVWELAQGPRWLPGVWFSEDKTPAAVKRWQRAVYDLLDTGLLKGAAGGHGGVRLTNIRLTASGRTLAEQLETEGAHDDAT